MERKINDYKENESKEQKIKVKMHISIYEKDYTNEKELPPIILYLTTEDDKGEYIEANESKNISTTLHSIIDNKELSNNEISHQRKIQNSKKSSDDNEEFIEEKVSSKRGIIMGSILLIIILCFLGIISSLLPKEHLPYYFIGMIPFTIIVTLLILETIYGEW